MDLVIVIVLIALISWLFKSCLTNVYTKAFYQSIFLKNSFFEGGIF